ncbi:MAG: hypothetical protein ACP5NX_04160 [Candidatus Bilamarchaeaceae archaeon]
MKGQGSTEYLVILAVVLIVALVVIGLLGWFPGVAGGAREQQSATYWQGASPFSVTAYKISGTSVTMTLANRLSQKVNLTAISFGGTNLTAFTSVNFKGGEEKTITGTLGAACGNAGDGFEYNLILYYNQGSISSILQTGDKPLVGKCS